MLQALRTFFSRPPKGRVSSCPLHHGRKEGVCYYCTAQGYCLGCKGPIFGGQHIVFAPTGTYCGPCYGQTYVECSDCHTIVRNKDTVLGYVCRGCCPDETPT